MQIVLTKDSFSAKQAMDSFKEGFDIVCIKDEKEYAKYIANLRKENKSFFEFTSRPTPPQIHKNFVRVSKQEAKFSK